MTGRTVEIVGAGPAGLSAALAARADGATVTVYEQRKDVGMRFHGDFQGLENWSSQTDVLAELESFGIQTDFSHTPVREVTYFDSGGATHQIRASDPLFYLVRRGADTGTLDHSLKTQALAAGVKIEFGRRHRHVPHGGVVAEGPHRADVIAVGYVFDTDMADGCYVAVTDRLAPAGYSYLLVDQGRGTVATCLFARFHDERRFLDETVAFFKREVGLHWRSAKRFGGSGNYHHVQSAVLGNRLYAGESAGFQDALFGFGLRYAFTSGHLAGRAGRSADSYEQAWRSRLAGLNASSIFNRWVFSKLGDRGRRQVLRRIAHSDPRHVLQRIYAPVWWKTVAAGWLPNKPLPGGEHLRHGCDCTWCRCHPEVRDAPKSGA
jgi:flavin-dependent dehydrogenase